MNTGKKSRFMERIKKIVFNKQKRKKIESPSEGHDKKNAIIRFLLFPVMLIDKKMYENESKKTNVATDAKETNADINVFLNSEQRVKKYKNRTIKYNFVSPSETNKPIYNDKNNVNKSNGVYQQNKTSNKPSLLTKNNKENILSNIPFLGVSKSNTEASKKKKKVTNSVDLTKSIIIELTKYLKKKNNDLETLESDLYVLSQFDGKNESLEKCREYMAKLNALQNKLNKIKKQYGILNSNIDFDDILEIDDNILLDKLIQFRDLAGTSLSLETSEEYKLLDEFKYLFFKLTEVEEGMNNLELEINDRKTLLKEANINFNDFQNKIYNLDKIKEETDILLNQQNEVLKGISDKVAEISTIEKNNYIYKGFLKVFFTGLKLMGLYMLTPFRKSVPGIAMATLTTKKTMDNLRESMKVEKKTEYVYSAPDYGMLFANSMNDLAKLDNLILSTLDAVKRTKSDFVFKFSSYAKQLPKYNNVIKKLDNMEKMMINNQIKVRVLSKKISEKRMINEKTLVKVKKMNNNS